MARDQEVMGGTILCPTQRGMWCTIVNYLKHDRGCADHLYTGLPTGVMWPAGWSHAQPNASSAGCTPAARPHLLQDGGHQGVVVVRAEDGLQPAQAGDEGGQQLMHPCGLRLPGPILRLAQLIAGHRIQYGPAHMAATDSG